MTLIAMTAGCDGLVRFRYPSDVPFPLWTFKSCIYIYVMTMFTIFYKLNSAHRIILTKKDCALFIEVFSSLFCFLIFFFFFKKKKMNK
jgi:hypothetical protein